MEFGKQDEVSGHCGPWVTLENKKDLHAYYPELMNVFYRGVMDPWSEGNDTKKLKAHVSGKEKIKSKSAPKYKLAMFFLMFFLSTIIIAYSAFKNPESIKIPDTLFAKDVDLDVVKDLFGKGDLQGFNSYMAKNKKVLYSPRDFPAS